MKILILTQYFYPENFKVNDLVEQLIARGHEVTVLTGKPNYPQGRYFQGYNFFKPFTDYYKTAKVFRCPLVSRGQSKFQLLVNYLSFAFFASVWILFIPKKRFDRIFIYEVSPITVAIPALVLKFFRKIHCTLWITDLWPESLSATGVVKNRNILSLVSQLVKFIYRKTDLVLMSSKAFKQSMLSHDAHEQKMKYFPQWAENFYQPINPIDVKVQKLPGKFKIIFAGNLGVAQGLEVIVEAAKLLKDIDDLEWIFIGDGRDKKRIEKMAKDYHLTKLTFLAQKPAEDMPQYFAQADLLLMTLRDEPIFSLTIPGKLQTYMACAKPIGAAISGEGARIIQEASCGFAVSAGNHHELAAEIKKFYQLSASERFQIGQNGLEYYRQNFDREKLISQLENWLR